MIYLIGGVPRSGKSYFSKLLAKKLDIALIDYDDITQTFQDMYPEYGLFMEMNQDEREALALPIVLSLIKRYRKMNQSIIIEGDHFNVHDWITYCKHSDNQLKLCFFCYANITPEQKVAINTQSIRKKYCWFEPLMLEQKLKIAQTFITKSNIIKNQLQSVNDSRIQYYDTQLHFDEVMNDAMNWIIG